MRLVKEFSIYREIKIEISIKLMDLSSYIFNKFNLNHNDSKLYNRSDEEDRSSKDTEQKKFEVNKKFFKNIKNITKFNIIFGDENITKNELTDLSNEFKNVEELKNAQVSLYVIPGYHK